MSAADGNGAGAADRSVIELDRYKLDGAPPPAAATPNEINIRKWLTNLFVHTVKVGERLLENGQLGAAAAAFADATLLTDRAEAFAAAVGRVCPKYFCRLYEKRMLVMGYGHLFPDNRRRRTAEDTDEGRGGSWQDERRSRPQDDSGSTTPAVAARLSLRDDDDDDDDDDKATPSSPSRCCRR